MPAFSVAKAFPVLKWIYFSSPKCSVDSLRGQSDGKNMRWEEKLNFPHKLNFYKRMQIFCEQRQSFSGTQNFCILLRNFGFARKRFVFSCKIVFPGETAFACKSTFSPTSPDPVKFCEGMQRFSWECNAFSRKSFVFT